MNYKTPKSNYYQSGGVYSVSLTTTNQIGSNSYTINNYVNVMNQNLNLVGDSSCGSSSLLLQSNSNVNNIKWYSSLYAQNLVEPVMAKTPFLIKQLLYRGK